ncbi:MAG TPA: hypothetical protein VHP12_10060 [Chitinophagaceae bacterium]|nr:hypothetical protein [Chitinophagaceae bacterium]
MSFLFVSNLSQSQTGYPKIGATASITHPIITVDKNETTTNFTNYYLVGFPVAINIWNTSKMAFSFEVVPYIKSIDGSSKMSNFLFHPGVLVPLGKGFGFTGRAAFETSGRYGFTPSVFKTIKKGKDISYFIATPVPFRFGNDLPASVTLAFIVGISF